MLCLHSYRPYSILIFRSQHEEIDLISEEEFYRSAPESISKPVSPTSTLGKCWYCVVCMCLHGRTRRGQMNTRECSVVSSGNWNRGNSEWGGGGTNGGGHGGYQ